MSSRVFINIVVVFQINRSDSDSSTLSKKSPFVRNASERRSMRMKKVKSRRLLFNISSALINKRVDMDVIISIFTVFSHYMDSLHLRVTCFTG